MTEGEPQEVKDIAIERIQDVIPASLVLFKSSTSIKPVGGIALRVTAYVITEEGDQFGIGLFWSKPDNELNSATVFEFDKKGNDYVDAWRAMQVLDRCKYLEYDFPRGALAFINDDYNLGTGEIDKDRWTPLVRTLSTKIAQNESLAEDYHDIPTVKRLIIALGGEKRADEVFKEIRQSAPSEVETEQANLRAKEAGVILDS